MQETKTETIKWIKCPKCGHKLFKAFSEETMVVRMFDKCGADGGDIEIKCHSCKAILNVSRGTK